MVITRGDRYETQTDGDFDGGDIVIDWMPHGSDYIPTCHAHPDPFLH
jgi:hypothetical protein